ncbi:uncharacterized protein K452DRAFT_67012 [Aplosporella prunicola CBS 121167]|uniref:Uncharacterized protein n=1 Tax=Aplosporella prunicola CBS 121167 TaxID=1176127 RepID=A0A6A6BV37_9PEZI|nr:uncharacterized protein K452DRAFT_67012 [Aplosporella prunicola CBS 121167]KAF2146531.1 hypothetical protein K452DRAFT_67012 [Aplosporella prunicola CBS 121167]
MPTLKQITCHIELSPSNASLREYDCTYDDGFVDALVAIPDEPAAFCVHLKSSGYIAPGLAMFVFKDGVYQCNRNKIGLRIPTADTPAYLTDVEFRVRQKEDRQGGQRFIGRDWCFEKLNGDNSDNVGFIEVVVLRCNDKYPDILLHLRRNSSTTAMQMSDDPADISGFYDGPRDDQRYGARYDGNFNERHRPYYYGQRPYDNEDLPFHSPESHMRPQPPTYSRGYSYEARRRRFERAPDDRHMPQEPASRDEFEEFIRWRDSRQSRSGYGTGLSEQPTNTDYYHAVHGQRTRATADMHIGGP